MGCFSSKPAVRRQPVTAPATKTPAQPIPTPQHLPKTQTIPEPKPTPTETLKTGPIPASNPSLPTPSPPNQHSAPNDSTTTHDLHTARETNDAPHTPTAPQVVKKPLNHDTHVTSTPAAPASSVPLIPAVSVTDQLDPTPATRVSPVPTISAANQLDQRNILLNSEQQPSSQHHAVIATEASVEPHHVKSAITTTSTIAPQPEVDDTTTNPHDESNTLPQPILATTSLIPEEISQPDSTNLESSAESNTKSLTTPTLASCEHYGAVPVSDHVSTQPLPTRLEEAEPDLVQNASGFVAEQEKTETQDLVLVPETDPPIEQYSAPEDSKTSPRLESTDEVSIERHIEPQVATLSPTVPDLASQPPQDSIDAQSNLANTASLIHENNVKTREDLADTGESDRHIPLGTSEEVLDTEEHNATAMIENVVPEHLTAAFVTDDSLTRQPKGDGSVATSFQQPHVQSDAEEPDTLAQSSTADTQPMPLSSENTDSLLEESSHPAVNRHEIFTLTKPEQCSSSSTSPQQHELDVTSDTQVKNNSKEAAQIAPIPVYIHPYTSSPLELEETRRGPAQYSTSIIATQKASHVQDQDLSSVANPTTEQVSAPEQLPAPHNSSAQDLSAPPPQDSIHVQSNPVSTSHPIPACPAVSDPTLDYADESSQPNHPIVSEDERMVGQHDISSKSMYVVPDDFKPAVETDVSLGSQAEVESSTGTPHEQPAVPLSSEQVVVPPHSSTARTTGTSVESGNTLSTPEESFNSVEAHLDGVTTASTEQSLNPEKSRSIVPPALDQDSSGSEASPLFVETATRTLPPVSSDGTLNHEEDTSFSRIAEEEGNGTAPTETFEEHDGSHGTRTPSFVGTDREDMESSASTNGMDDHDTRTPSFVGTNEEDIESSPSTNGMDDHGTRTPSFVGTDKEDMESSTSTNDMGDHGTRTPSFVGTNEEDMESSASTNGMDDHGTRTPSTNEEDIDFSHVESPPSSSLFARPEARTPRTFVDDIEHSHATSRSTWDYTTPYRGGCDSWVMNNPPHGVGYYSFENYHGNIGTNLPRGAYHYQNNGTDGGFYIKNSDGSSYHYSPYRGGRYNEPYY